MFILYNMSELIVVECRNKTAAQASPSTPNGDWQTNLQEHITIEQGDEIIARNVFIDTKAATSPQEKIVVPETIELTMNYFLYNMNWQGAVAKRNLDSDPWETDTENSAIVPFSNQTGVNVAKNDGKMYVACDRIPAPTGAATFAYLKTFVIVAVYVFLNNGQGGGFKVSLFYDDINGVATHTAINLPAVNSNWGNEPYNIPADIVYQNNGSPTFPPGSPNAGQQQDTPIGIYVANSDGSPNFNIRLDGNRNYPAGKESSFYKNTRIPPVKPGSPFTKESVVPRKFTTTIEIEGGKEVAYDPTELAQYINRQFTELRPTTITESQLTGDNKFLQHVGKGEPTANAAFNNFVEVRTDNTATELHGFTYNTGSTGNEGARWVGASQVELAYDPTTRKFAFNFLHTPIFAGGAINTGIVRAQQYPSGAFETFVVNRNGGLLIQSLTSTIKGTTNTAQFWEKELGFGQAQPNSSHLSLDYLYTTPEIKSETDDGTDHTINGESLAVPIFNQGVEQGVKTTGGFIGLDSMVQKGAAGSPNPFYEVPVLPTSTGANEIFSTSDKQIEIEALNSVLNSKSGVAFGYFLAEVRAQFKGSPLINQDTTRKNIMSIVSRYYEQNSYTSAASGSAVIYQHTSPEPVLLNSFKCRILDSDGNLADNIGQDNTIFIEIVKQKQMAQKALPESKVGMKEK